jgi:hypothetical protein
MAKKKLSYGTKKLVIDMKKIRDEFAHIGFIPDERLTEGALSKSLEKTASDMIAELNKRSSMRETQGGDAPYFTNPEINRGVFDRPFESATVTTQVFQGSEYKVSVNAPLTTTKGQTVDLIDVLQSGRNRKQMPSDKRVIFPATQKGSERLIKKRLGGVKSVKLIFRANKARYKRKKGKLVMVSIDYLPATESRDILGVIARDLENRISKQKIVIPSLGISGNIGKDLIKVKVDK